MPTLVLQNTEDPGSGGLSSPRGDSVPQAAPAGFAQDASRLRMALFYAAQQEPRQYARQLRIQEQTGIPPVVSAGREQEIEQAIEARRMDARRLVMTAPKIAAWATKPDNAAVSGADEIQRMAGVEQGAGRMQAAAVSAQVLKMVMALRDVAQRVTPAVTATHAATGRRIGTKDGGATWRELERVV